MEKYSSPGTLWVSWFVISIVLIINKYKSDKSNFFSFSWVYMFILFLFFLCSIYTYYVDKSKSQEMSIASFISGLIIFIPLINLIFAILAIHLGIKSIKKIRQNPKQFGGKWFAILGIILGALVYATYSTGIGMCLLGFEDICKNIGLSFLA